MAHRSSSAPACNVPSEVIADRYELVELLGTGGMSTVYKAHDELLERHVAIKILHPHYSDDREYVERFRHEARAVAQLSHPRIVTVIDRGEDAGRQFIVFECVDGENLKQHLARNGPLPIRRALEIACQIADGLAFAHEHGLVHRDVKPQNVLLTPDGDAKVTDFGIARSLDVDKGVTQTGTVLGTSNYLSPEQASGSTTTPLTDVYSLGVVLYELLTGEVPFPGDNFVAIAMKHATEPPPDLLERRPDVPLRLAAAVDRALQKDPSRRFQSMAEFEAELRRTLAEMSEPDAERTFVAPRRVLKESSPRRTTPRRRRWPILLPLVVLLATAAIVAGILALGGSKGPQQQASASGGGHPVPVTGVSGYDPQGSGVEHDEDAPSATDGDAATYWSTEHYSSSDFGGLKDGVGLMVDTGRATTLKQLTVSSDTPGFSAQIDVGSSRSGTFVADSKVAVVSGRTTFDLQGRSGRYYVIWITNLGPHSSVHVNEVKARN